MSTYEVMTDGYYEPPDEYYGYKEYRTFREYILDKIKSKGQDAGFYAMGEQVESPYKRADYKEAWEEGFREGEEAMGEILWTLWGEMYG